MRFQILMTLANNPRTTTRQLAEQLGYKSTRNVDLHLIQLRKEGLVIEKFDKTGKDEERVTDAGKIVVKYVMESRQGVSLYHRTLLKYFPKQSQEITTKIREICAELDEDYALRRACSTHFNYKLQKNVLERIASSAEIVKAAKMYPMAWMAANAVGLSEGAFDQRLMKLFDRAHKELCESNECSVCGKILNRKT